MIANIIRKHLVTGSFIISSAWSFEASCILKEIWWNSEKDYWVRGNLLIRSSAYENLCLPFNASDENSWRISLFSLSLSLSLSLSAIIV